MGDTYLTVDGRGHASFEIRGSEFLGHIRQAQTVEDAESFIQSIRNEYEDATHNVPAYRIRDDPLREWASDDGEPSGSAGKPALNVLEQEGVQNVVAVVTRYYGGTNLGVGGLARAYSRGVKDTLEAAGTVEKRPQERFLVTTEYDDSGTVRGILESSEANFEAEYQATVTFQVTAPEETAPRLRERLRDATSDRVSFE